MATVCKYSGHISITRSLLKSSRNVQKTTRACAQHPSPAEAGFGSRQFHHVSSARNSQYVYAKHDYLMRSRSAKWTAVENKWCQPSRHISTTTRQLQQHESDSTDSTQQTYDKSEVEKFSRIADEWWNEQGEFGALHALNVLRIPLVRDGILGNVEGEVPVIKPLSGMKVVDVGCGGGIVSEPLARLGAEVLGVDASAENIAVAQTHSADDPDLAGRLSYRQCLVEDLAAEMGPVYDGVVASEVLEHVADPRLFVQACCDLLKPGGSVFFTTMNRTQIAYALAVVAAEKIFRIVPDGAHDFNKFITPEELTAMLKDSEAEVQLVHGMMLNPVSLQWCWTKDTSINYSLHAIKLGTRL